MEKKDVDQDILEHIREKQKEIPLFPKILCKWITTLPNEPLTLSPLGKYAIAPTQDWAVFHEENFEGALTFSGIHSGLGEIHFQDVHVVSFGPKHFPLGDMSSYGIFHPIFPSKKMGEAYFSFRDGRLLGEGWIRLCHKKALLHVGSEIWLKLHIKVDPQTIELVYSRLPFSSDPSFLLAFIIEAKSCQVDGITLLPGSLDQFCGTPPRVLSFRGKEASIQFFLENVAKVHIIPLAGNGCFFDGSFLVGIEQNFDKTYAKIILQPLI